METPGAHTPPVPVSSANNIESPCRRGSTAPPSSPRPLSCLFVPMSPHKCFSLFHCSSFAPRPPTLCSPHTNTTDEGQPFTSLTPHAPILFGILAEHVPPLCLVHLISICFCRCCKCCKSAKSAIKRQRVTRRMGTAREWCFSRWKKQTWSSDAVGVERRHVRHQSGFRCHLHLGSVPHPESIAWTGNMGHIFAFPLSPSPQLCCGFRPLSDLIYFHISLLSSQRLLCGYIHRLSQAPTSFSYILSGVCRCLN